MPELVIESKTHGTHTVLFDEEDRELIESYTWHIWLGNKNKAYYAITNIPDPNRDDWYIRPSDGTRRKKRTTLRMHRLLTNCPKHLQVDHLNHNGLDNRKKNLRICTNLENQHNKKPDTRNSSGFKGVSWSKRDRRWCAMSSINGVMTNLGLFKTKEESARVYDANVYHYHGKFAYRNFPDEKINQKLIIQIRNNNLAKNNKSGFHGVKKSGNKWVATTTINKKRIYIGTFATALEAAKARDAKIKEAMGESWKDQNYVKLNFPDE